MIITTDSESIDKMLTATAEAYGRTPDQIANDILRAACLVWLDGRFTAQLNVRNSIDAIQKGVNTNA